MKIVTLSSKNQIALPYSMTTLLGLKPKQKIMIEFIKNEIVLKPLNLSIVEQTAGSLTQYVQPSKLGKDMGTIMKETKKRTARYLALKK